MYLNPILDHGSKRGEKADRSSGKRHIEAGEGSADKQQIGECPRRRSCSASGRMTASRSNAVLRKPSAKIASLYLNPTRS
jgi:hypothetical protein